MPKTHESQDRYSKLVLAKLRAELVLRDGVVFNNDYEGDPVAGKVRIPVRDTEVAVGDYDVATGKAITQGATTYLDILVNKDKAVNELIDGFEAAAVPDNLVADRLDSAAYSLGAQLDNDGGTVLLSEGTTNNVALITKDTVYSAMVDIRTKMSKANIPLTQRYALVTPDFFALLLKSPEFIKASDLGDAVVQSGAIGKIAGFTVYEWNDSTPGLSCVCGHPRWATRVNEWSVPISVKDLTNAYIGASAVQGRLVYTHKVTRAAAVQAVYSPAALTASAAASSTANKTTVSATAGQGGTAKWRILTGARAVYGQGDTGFKALNVDAEPAIGDVIEVVEFVSSAAVAVKYITVTAEMIG